MANTKKRLYSDLEKAFNTQNTATEPTKQPQATDPTKQPQATTQADVNNQDAKTRTWQSLESTYGQRIEESNKAYDQSKIAADMAALQRGMGRSSYALQTAANIDQQKATAADRIRSEMVADYQNRLGQIEQQELENKRYDEQWAYQKERDSVADKQWKLQFDAQQEQFKQQFEYNKMTQEQQIAYNSLMNMLEKGDKPTDDLLKKAGISRHDYEQMKKAVPKRTGGNSPSGEWSKYGLTKAQWNALTDEQRNALRSGQVSSQAGYERLLREINDYLHILKNKQNKPTGNGIHGIATIE